ncbi:unnamed protein product, partial [Porites lobata]
RRETIKDKARFLPPTVYVNEQNYTKVHFSTDEEIDSSSTKRSGEVINYETDSDADLFYNKDGVRMPMLPDLDDNTTYVLRKEGT